MNFGDIIYFEKADGSVVSAKYGSLCQALGPLREDCTKCVLKHKHGYDSCSEFAVSEPDSFSALTGLRPLLDAKDAKEELAKTGGAEETRETILDAAKKYVCGDRDEQYGSPEDSFSAIAALWGDYISARGVVFPAGFDLSAKDVAAMMVLLKMARVATGQNKADNWIDAAGYAACGGEIGGNAHG